MTRSLKNPATKQPLTDRQREVLDFIRTDTARRGFPPSVREIGDRFWIASLNGVVCHLRALQAKGYIKIEPNTSRAIKIVERPGKQQRQGLCPHCGGTIG